MADGAGEVEQYRRDPDRDASGTGEPVRIRAALRLRRSAPASSCRPNRRGMLRKLNRWGKTSLASVAMGHEVSVTDAATGAGLLGDRQRRAAGEAAADSAQGRPDDAGRAAAAHHPAGDRHHHAPDDGGRGAVRHGQDRRAWTATRAAGRPARRRFSIPRRTITRTYTTRRSWVSRR